LPALSGLPALDVAIGLFFVFFLLSLVCSAINETIATVFAWRSKTLLNGLSSMLAEPAHPPAHSKQPHGQATAPSAVPAPATSAETAGAGGRTAEPKGPAPLILPRLLDHPLIRSQVDETARHPLRRAVPSYLAPRTFSLALMNTLSDDAKPGDDPLVRITEAVEGLDNPHVKKALEALLEDSAGKIDRFRDGVEGWFDATMSRASGWYKRRAQLSLWVIAAVVALAFNADAGQIASTLWKDPTLRATVAAQAEKAASEGNATDLGGGSAGGETLAARIDRVKQLSLPIGWSTDRADPRWPDDGAGWVAKILGLLATIVALSMGAPFWFDLLGRISRVRGGGAPPPRAA
jgi:hypothetical protein